jgi:hypothetical protein
MAIPILGSLLPAGEIDRNSGQRQGHTRKLHPKKQNDGVAQTSCGPATAAIRTGKGDCDVTINAH